MIGNAETKIGMVKVLTSNNRGFSPEEVADRCLDKILFVSESAPSAIKEQAQAYRENLRAVLVFYMKEAIRSDRTTIFNALVDAGQRDLANMIRRL